MRVPRGLELVLAVEAGDVPKVTSLLATGSPATASDVSGASAIARASQRGHVAIVELLLAHGARPDVLALHGALRHEDDAVLDVLLRAGADPRWTRDGFTAVMAAARRGSLARLRRLVDLGVDPHAVDDVGKTALDVAVSSQRPEVAAWLRGLGVAEGWAPRRALVRALTKAFGGSAREVSGGKWLVEPKRLGPDVQLTVTPQGYTAGFFRRRFRARALDERGTARLTVTGPGRTPELTDADDSLRAAIRDAGPAWESLDLGDGDVLRVGGGAASLSCAGHDADRAVARIGILGRIVSQLTVERRAPPALVDEPLIVKRAPAERAEAAGGPRHLSGGLADPLRACPECSFPMTRILRLDLTDPRLARILPGHAVLEASTCVDCGPSGPRFVEHAAPDDGARLDADDVPELVLPERPVRLEPGARAGSRAVSRVGGSPSWLQGDETPSCPRCSNDMALALQVTSSRAVSFGDEGRLYVFACPGCLVTATLVQSH